MRRLGTIVALLASSAFLSAQSIQPLPPASPSAALAAAVNASGGTALGDIKDFKATGTITYSDTNDASEGTVSIRAIGPDVIRCDIAIGGANRSWFVQGLAGASKIGDAKPIPLPIEIAANLKHYALPIFGLATSPDRAKAAASRDGDGPQTSRLTFDSSPAKANALKFPGVEFLIGPDNQIQSVSGMVRGRRSKADPVRQEIRFSDYRAVNGVMFPFSIEERVGNQRVSVIHIQDVVVNSGISIADLKF